METRHLFTALMLPALFTACTSEDLVSTQESVDLSNRPVAGNVTLTFNTEADSRLDANFNWVVGDKIGACLMDEYIPGKGLPEEKAPWMKDYKFVDYIQTNYRYNYAGEGVWENADLLSSGNYFFYYPYTAQLNARKAFEKYLNADQKLEGQDSESLRKLINDNQMYVGYNFVEGATEGDMQPLNVTMKPIFAFPAFTIENTGTKTRTITKIALQKDTEDWDLVATIDPTVIESNCATTLAEDPGKAVKWSSTPTLDEDAIGSAKQIQVTMPEGTKLAAGGKLNTYIVVPAGKYANAGEKVTMYIYTTDGVVTAKLDAKHINSGTTNQYNVTNDVAFADIYPTKVDGKYFLANITFDDLGVDTPNETTVSSTEDLDMYMSWFKDYQGTGGTDLTINTIGDNVTLSKSVYDILKNNGTLKVTVKGNLTLAEEVGEDVLKLFTIDNTECEITNLANIQVPASLAAKVTLVNKGTATLADIASYKCMFKNEGTMNINATEGTKTVTISTNNEYQFINEGIVNVNSNLNIPYYGIKNNCGTVSINAATTNAKIDNSFKKNLEGDGYYTGYIVVAKDAKWITVGSQGFNNGRIDNYGTISVPGAYTNNDKTNNAYIEDKDTKYYTPEINNFGKLEGVKNMGLVTMKGENSEIKSATGSEGEIDNTECSRFVVKGTTETVFVKITASTETKAVATLVGNAKASKVKFDNAGTLTITEEKDSDGKLINQALVVDAIDITGDLNIAGENRTLRIYGSGSPATGGTITIKSGTTLIKDYAKVLVGGSSYGATVAIEEGATLKVSNSAEFSGYSESKKATITGTGTVSNYGTMENIEE